MKKLLLPFIVLFFSLNAAKAETYNLDLAKSIEIAKEKSYTMKNLVQDFKIAEYNLKSATSRFRTHIDLNFVAPEYTETIRKDEDSTGISFYSVRQLQYETNLIVNQPLPTDGNIYIRSGLANYDDLNSNSRSSYLSTRFGLTQPIDALYGYNSIKSSLKQAQLAYERSSKQLKREELNLVYDVSSAFYNLLSVQKSEEIARLDLDRQKEAFTIAKNKYKPDLSAKWMRYKWKLIWPRHKTITTWPS